MNKLMIEQKLDDVKAEAEEVCTERRRHNNQVARQMDRPAKRIPRPKKKRNTLSPEELEFLLGIS